MTENNEHVSLRQFIEAIINERDRSYDGRFKAAEIAVNAALIAQKEAVSTAFTAAEKATIKAEEAQRIYNEGHNNLVRKIDDQYNHMMPRTESIARMDAMMLIVENLRNEIRELRESRSQLEGTRLGIKEFGAYAIAGISIIISIVLHFLGK